MRFFNGVLYTGFYTGQAARAFLALKKTMAWTESKPLQRIGGLIGPWTRGMDALQVAQGALCWDTGAAEMMILSSGELVVSMKIRNESERENLVSKAVSMAIGDPVSKELGLREQLKRLKAELAGLGPWSIPPDPFKQSILEAKMREKSYLRSLDDVSSFSGIMQCRKDFWRIYSDGEFEELGL